MFMFRAPFFEDSRLANIEATPRFSGAVLDLVQLSLLSVFSLSVCPAERGGGEEGTGGGGDGAVTGWRGRGRSQRGGDGPRVWAGDEVCCCFSTASFLIQPLELSGVRRTLAERSWTADNLRAFPWKLRV